MPTRAYISSPRQFQESTLVIGKELHPCRPSVDVSCMSVQAEVSKSGCFSWLHSWDFAPCTTVSVAKRLPRSVEMFVVVEESVLGGV